jgi:hypothetical protein
MNIPLAQVNIGLLANQVGVTAADTLDLGQGVHDLLLAVNIGVEQTQDVLEVRLLAGHERCRHGKKEVSLLFSPSFCNFLFSKSLPRTAFRSGEYFHHCNYFPNT